MSEKHNLHLCYISEDKFTKIVIQSLPPFSDPLTGWLSSLITLTPLASSHYAICTAPQPTTVLICIASCKDIFPNAKFGQWLKF